MGIEAPSPTKSRNNSRTKASDVLASQKISVEMWRNLETTLVWAYRGNISPVYVDFLSENRHFTAWLIIEGEVQLTSGKDKIVARAGQWIFAKPGTHRQIFHPQTRLLSIHFQMAWLTGQPVFPTMPDFVTKSESCPDLERVAMELEHFVSHGFDRPGLDLLKTPVSLKDYQRMRELFNRWILLYCETLQKAGMEMSFPRDSDPRVNQALQVLAGWPLKMLFNEEKIASTIGISISHMNRLFLLETGTTPRKIFETRRLEFAKRNLRLPHSSIKEIASELGFSHLGNFSKWFHRIEGISPREFQHADSTQLLT